MNHPKHRGISKPPGTALLRLAEVFASRRFYDHVLSQIIADMQYEYFEALSEGKPMKASVARIRGLVAFVTGLVAGIFAWSGVGGMRNLAVVGGGALLGWYAFGGIGALFGALLGVVISAARNAQLEREGDEHDR